MYKCVTTQADSSKTDFSLAPDPLLIYVESRARANTAVWLDLGHMIRGEHIREIWG
jgi:hypothetical protein